MDVKEVAKILEAKGVRLAIGGCGCCGSPWVKIEVDGEFIVGSKDEEIDAYDIDMFEKG